MYQCIIPPRVFLAVGVGLLIFSLVLGWISFSVPDWLQFYERSLLRNNTITNLSNDQYTYDSSLNVLKKFGLWYKCIFTADSNDFLCTVWNNDAPSFVRVAQVLIPFGLSFGCLSLLSSTMGLMCRRTFVSTVLFAALFAFLSFIFTTIGITVFATESLVYVERLRFVQNENPRGWGMWLIIPNLALSFLASLCFILASIFNWCDYRSMHVTGILSHTVDKYGGSVMKAPSDSNMTSAIRKQQYLQSHPLSTQDYPNTCYQITGTNSNQNSSSYPHSSGYNGPMHQQGNGGVINPAFQTAPGLFGYSRPPSPLYPSANFDPYHHRNCMTENSETEDIPRTSRSNRRSRSRHQSGRRSRSHSPRENVANPSNAHDNNTKPPQFIPIPIPYFQSHTQAQPPSNPATTNNNITSSNNNTNNNAITQPISYVIQQPKPQIIEEIVQPTTKTNNMLTYTSAQPSLIVSNPTQPIYTIAYRTNNTGNVLAPNILTGPAATTYVTAARTQLNEVNSLNSDSDNEERGNRTLSKRCHLKKLNSNQAWTWCKL